MRWLLLLGAESRYGHALEAALADLAALAPVHALAPARETAAAHGGAGRYRNQLACLAHPGPRAALVTALKRIERAHGRGMLDGVPLDIDLLACDAGSGWRPDAHALGKGEFDAAHVRQLLVEAGLDMQAHPRAGEGGHGPGIGASGRG